MNKILKLVVIVLSLTFLSGPVLACGMHGGMWGFSPAGAERTPYSPPANAENNSQKARPNFSRSINDEIIVEAQARMAELKAKAEARKAAALEAQAQEADKLPAE